MTEVTPEDAIEQAWRIVVNALDLALKKEFPLGFASVEMHMDLKGAMQYLGDQLKKLFPEEEPVPAVQALQHKMEVHRLVKTDDGPVVKGELVTECEECGTDLMEQALPDEVVDPVEQARREGKAEGVAMSEAYAAKVAAKTEESN